MQLRETELVGDFPNLNSRELGWEEGWLSAV